MRELKQIVVMMLAIAMMAVVGYGCKKSKGDSANDFMTEFKVDDRKAAILHTKKTVKLSMPYGTDLTALKPEIKVSKYATVVPASGVVMDFTEPVEYTVTAQDLTERVYTVTVKHSDPSKKTSVEYFGVRVGDGDISGFIMDELITIEVPTGTDLTALVPTIKISKLATISPESGVAQDFSQPLEYVVTAQDPEVKLTYTVKVIEI